MRCLLALTYLDIDLPLLPFVTAQDASGPSTSVTTTRTGAYCLGMAKIPLAEIEVMCRRAEMRVRGMVTVSKETVLHVLGEYEYAVSTVPRTLLPFSWFIKAT